MNPYKAQQRVQIDESETPKYEGDVQEEEQQEEKWMRLRPSDSNVTEDQEPFMGIKVRRKASLRREYKGDYLDVPSRPFLMKILRKQGKMKRRILMITDFAIYIVDPDTDVLKRRIALAAVDKMCLSELSDNFFAIIIPTEYDLLMASTRKTEIVTVLVEATKSASEYELEVVFSNRFEYNASADLIKEVQFEEVEGGVRTRIVRK
ncbi:myosin heavy chain IB-like isoform X2 [Durio zibethinus]|uniref:Myosin heavy chain IB-like isoform X2 n=1 Tax=Durio zibethinus TaxID=66656 RepID=A0A6P6AH97_DURZI|nr:myosin heavy chain IB-like isoform X2 [Durio zibethinus]